MAGMYPRLALIWLLFLLPLASAEPIPDYDNPYSPIFFDQPAYSWTDKVTITIVAPSWNTDRHLIDAIGNEPEHPVKVSTRGFSLDQYKLAETDANSGIFSGEVILTGFHHDVDGDGDPDTAPRTSGGGPTNGFLETEHDSAITVSFEFADGVVVAESAPISWSVGTIEFLDEYPDTHQRLTVRVHDPDMNLHPERIDGFAVDVFSNTDLAGASFDVTETDPDSGLFEGTILLEPNPHNGHRVFAMPGGTVSAWYQDRTLPLPYDISDELAISAQVLLRHDAGATGRAQILDVSLADSSGGPLSKISPGQQVQIVGEIKNSQEFEQPFAFIVQVRDSDGTVRKISWTSSSLPPGGAVEVSQMWVPALAGSYTMESFVWESVPSMVPISEHKTTQVHVR